MNVCESCKQLCDGIGPYCFECREEFELIEESLNPGHPDDPLSDEHDDNDLTDIPNFGE